MLNIFEIIIVGLVLSADSFSAALAMGGRPHQRSDGLKFSFVSSFSSLIVFCFGAMAGEKIIAEFDSIDHWISFSLLMIVSIHMLKESFSKTKKEIKKDKEKFHSIYKILLISFATSLDAFAVGVSLGITGKRIFPYALSVCFWGFIATISGLKIASISSKKFGPIFSVIGGVVLAALACKLLIEGL